jgi:hypothetical protein
MKYTKLLAIALFMCLFCSAQINVLPYTENFTSGFNGWVTRTTGGNNFNWFNNAGFGGTGGVRTKFPADSNFITSPQISLQANKSYTITFKARQDISDQKRRIVVGFNQARSRIGVTNFCDIPKL